MNQRYDVASTTIQEESSTSQNDSGLSQYESDKAKKSSFVSGNRSGENFIMTHLPAKSNVYRNICF